jgi:hypothetical protein
MMSAEDYKELTTWLREQADKPTQAMYANRYRRIALVLESLVEKQREMQRSIEYAHSQSQGIQDALGRHI